MPETATRQSEQYANWRIPTVQRIDTARLQLIPLVTRGFIPEVDGYQSPQERRGVQVSTLRQQLDEVAKLQKKWDTTLDIQRKAGQFSNYEPIFARWRYDHARTDRERELFRSDEIQNIKTALRERNHSAASELILTIDRQGKIRESSHADDPWEKIIERGRVYRVEHGSKETIREQAEVDGFKKIQTHLTDSYTPIGAMDIVISRPGTKGGPYPDNYIDIYRKAKDSATGELFIQYTRFISPLDEPQTENIVRRIDSNYFDGESMPRDAWYLQKPIKIAPGSYSSIKEGFEALFKIDVKAMQEAEFQSLWSVYLPAVLYYLDVLTQEKFEPKEIEEIAKAWNTVLLSTENESLKKQAKEVTVFISPDATHLDTDASLIMGAMSNKYGYEKPKTIAGGCGSSGGTDIENNSVGQFDPEGNKEGKKCPHCPVDASNNHYHCPGCNEYYSSEIDVAAEMRTKECGKCPEKLGC